MKAVLLTNHGGLETLRYGEAPDPIAGPGEVVVDIHAASVNAADYKVRLGSGRSNLRFPHILGRDFSGVVSEVGTGVTDLAVGDAVFGVCDQGIEGAYAEKIAIKAAIIAKKPDRLGHAEAAAMALTSITALWALEDTAQLKAGETILVQGGAGGVAGFGIQFAKHIGATVITTASANNHDYVRRLGADRVIDYNTEDFTKTVADCDVVFDTVGGEVQIRSYAVLKPGGRFLCLEFSHLDVEMLQKAYDAFSFTVIPAVGKVVTGDGQPYRYLVESIRTFPKQEQFKTMIDAAGFTRVSYRNLSGGIVAIHSGWRI